MKVPPASACTAFACLPLRPPAQSPIDVAPRRGVVTASLPDDRSYMLEALALAARVPHRTWPNPPVGAVVVGEDGLVAGRGAHHGPGTRHAEAAALDEAGEGARGGTLYCTLEPCNHHGRTPPCAPRLAASGIRRLVVGVRDPNPAVAGGGLHLVRQAGVAVTLGTAAEECLEVIWPFVVTEAFARPFVLLKTATSLDGRFAPPRPATSESRPALAGPAYLTGLEARHDVHRLRRWADLVLVGAGTVAADRPSLDGRLAQDGDQCPHDDPRRGYVDTDLDVEPPWVGSKFLVFGGRESAAPVRAGSLEARGGTVVLCDERNRLVDLASLLSRLAGVGVHVVLVEGGPRLAHSFLSDDLVDRWVSYVAPDVLGGGPAWPDSGAHGSIALGSDQPREPRCPRSSFHLTRCERIGEDVRLVHDRRSFHDTLRRVTAAAVEA